MSKFSNVVTIIAYSGIYRDIPKLLLNDSDTYTTLDNHKEVFAMISLIENDLAFIKSSKNSQIKQLSSHVLRKLHEKFQTS